MNAWWVGMLGVAAWAALSQAMDKHHAQVRGAEPDRTAVWRWRGMGVLLLLLALLQCLHHWSASVAVVAWLGALTLAGLLVGLTLTYAPQRLGRLAIGCGVVGLLGALACW